MSEDDFADFFNEPGATASRLRVLLEFDRWLVDLGFKTKEIEEECDFDEEASGRFLLSELRRVLKGRENE
jgi:hypothetical protein